MRTTVMIGGTQEVLAAITQDVLELTDHLVAHQSDAARITRLARHHGWDMHLLGQGCFELIRGQAHIEVLLTADGVLGYADLDGRRAIDLPDLLAHLLTG